MGGITLPPFYLPLGAPAFTFGAANLMTQQPPAPRCHHSKICEVPSDVGTLQMPHIPVDATFQHLPTDRSVHQSQPRLCRCPEPSSAGSRQLGNEA